METNRRFTILTFPQHFDGHNLTLNILFLPRNQNPLKPAIESNATIPKAPSFAEANLSFVAKVITGLEDFPMNVKVTKTIPLVTKMPNPADRQALFTALAKSFTITNLNQLNIDLDANADKAPLPKKTADVLTSVRKYLPLTYRGSFNFVAPKVKNAVIDDTYFCAVRDARKQPGFTPSPDTVSWGKVFAFALRQSNLAEALGMIYKKTSFSVDASLFPKGGWLYIDVADSSDYRQQGDVDDVFIKKYAARVPALEIGTERSLFAAVQFPVLFKKPTDLVDPKPEGKFDPIFIEASDYDDGFAKIVHAFQPVSQNLLLEESDGFHPTKDLGIRLGWDDEQILIWYMRQMMEDETIPSGSRIDSPIGVFGYRIDVKKEGAADWESLNKVKNKVPLTINGNNIADFDDELLYQVFPSQLDGDKDKSYWLPMYFASWHGKSMVLPDDDAVSIYQNDQGDVQADGGTHITGPAQTGLAKMYKPEPITTALQYGTVYEFRVRLGDLTSGGPDKKAPPAHEGPSPTATCHFKRYVAPNTVRIDDIPANSDQLVFDKDKLVVKRPLLGYPSVVFTGKYVDPVALLKKAAKEQVDTVRQNKKDIDDGHPEKVKPVEAFGIADPDVESVEVTVEVQALNMDYLLSVSGKESYCKLYTTTRKFPVNFDDELDIPLDYIDCNVLKFGDPSDLGDLGVNQAQLDGMAELVVPRARNIRLTLRALCKETLGYYGNETDNPDLNTRYGRTRHVMLYQPSLKETGLFAATSEARRVKGIYLQPDPPPVFDGNFVNLLVGKQVQKMPDMVQRLAQELGLENSGLTLVGKKGERVQFGCSNRIRHTMAPDNSSITFASKGDLMNHWLCCLTLQIDRDWTWDALEPVSFFITREKQFKQDAETEKLLVGDIEVRRTISINALKNPDRSKTTLIFIDAVEPKKEPKAPPHDKEPQFPDLIELTYTIETSFKKGHAATKDGPLTLTLELPVTNTPAQIPKIASAGIALSPYWRSPGYSFTEPRRRFLWIELEEPVEDPNDLYFARVLGYAPDQLLSNNHPDLLIPPDEPSLPIDPEYIRVITPDQPDDEAGIDAMQPMEKALDSDTHYLLPLPSGLHSESAELFGFFTYEFRLGHAKIWSTAQGRFGRPLRATGIQHPAPVLTCIVNRDEEKVYVTAPYAVTVHDGKNVTADPPGTELWALLYAQVKQADNKDFRNVLLDDKVLDPNVQVRYDGLVDLAGPTDDAQRIALQRAVIRNWKIGIDPGKLAQLYKVVDPTTVNKDATKYGTVIWTNTEVNQLLALYGLPPDSSLSVLCVEILPQITNIYEQVSRIDRKDIQDNLRATVASENFPSAGAIQEGLAARTMALQSVSFNEARPLSDQLGNYRILRTSPLAEVPFVCVT